MKDSDHVKINSVNPLYLIIGEVDGYIEENNGNKYLNFASTDKNKKVLEKYTKLSDKIKLLLLLLLLLLIYFKLTSSQHFVYNKYNKNSLGLI